MTVAIPPCVIPVSVVGVGKGKECDCDSGASTKSRNEASEPEAFLRLESPKKPDHVVFARSRVCATLFHVCVLSCRYSVGLDS